MSSFLKQFTGQSSSTLGQFIFVVGTIVLNLLASLIWDLLPYEHIIFRLIVIIFIVVIAYVVFVFYSQRISQELRIDAGEHVLPFKHVVTGLSWLNHPLEDEEQKGRPSNLRTIINLIDKHEAKLQTLHVIVSEASGVSRAKAELQYWLERNPHSFNVRYINIEDGYDMGEVFKLTKQHLHTLADEGVKLEQEALLDVTAGTAAISAGMTMAALSTGVDITYQATEYGRENQLQGDTTWQFYKNRIVQIWERYPAG